MVEIGEEEAASIIGIFPEDVRADLAFAYGSGAVKQASYDYNKSRDLPMLDLILSVDDSEAWHAANKKKNPGHYTSLVDLSPRNIAWLQRKVGAGVWFNALVPMGISSQPNRLMKYGVIDGSTLENDLLNWEAGLYVAGRLHKPVKLLSNNAYLDEMMEINRKNALITALALLPDRFDESELYMTIASLSYTGDPRMGIGENPNKVANLVSPMLSAYRELYRDVLASMDSSVLRKVTLLPHVDKTTYLIDSSPNCRKFLHSHLPRSIQRNLPPARHGNVASREYVHHALASVVSRAATPQTLKGLFTAGAVKSAVYAAAKITKRFK